MMTNRKPGPLFTFIQKRSFSRMYWPLITKNLTWVLCQQVCIVLHTIPSLPWAILIMVDILNWERCIDIYKVIRQTFIYTKTVLVPRLFQFRPQMFVNILLRIVLMERAGIGTIWQ